MSRRGAVLFVAMGVIWGIPYLLIRVAVREVPPASLVFARTGIGAALLVPVALARRELRPVLAAWRPLLAYTVAELAVPWVLLSRAEERLSSSLVSLLVATVPLVGAAIAVVGGRRGDPAGVAGLGGRRRAGLACGLVGVALLVGFDVAGADLPTAATVAVVVVGYATGPAIVARWLGGVPALGVTAASLLLCACAYAPWGIAGLHGGLPTRVVLAVVVLGVVCTAAAFLVFFALIAEVGAARATVITYVNPAVAVVLGVVFLHESFGWSVAAGFALILVGSWFATGRDGPLLAGTLRRSRPAGP